MTFLELQDKFDQSIFTIVDVVKEFPEELDSSLRVQLSRLVKKGYILEIKRGLYYFPKAKIDELNLAGYLYQPAYISLETALNYYGIIPDIPLGVTCVTPTTTKKFVNQFGHFHFQKIRKELFWGFKSVENYQIAFPEKALLDFFYIRRKSSILDLRMDLTRIDWKVYNKFAKEFPRWISKIKLHD